MNEIPLTLKWEYDPTYILEYPSLILLKKNNSSIHPDLYNFLIDNMSNNETFDEVYNHFINDVFYLDLLNLFSFKKLNPNVEPNKVLKLSYEIYIEQLYDQWKSHPSIIRLFHCIDEMDSIQDKSNINFFKELFNFNLLPYFHEYFSKLIIPNTCNQSLQVLESNLIHQIHIFITSFK